MGTSDFPQVEVLSNNALDCFAEYLAHVNAAETPHQIIAMTRDTVVPFGTSSRQCLDRLPSHSYMHLIQKRPFTTAFLSTGTRPSKSCVGVRAGVEGPLAVARPPPPPRAGMRARRAGWRRRRRTSNLRSIRPSIHPSIHPSQAQRE